MAPSQQNYINLVLDGDDSSSSDQSPPLRPRPSTAAAAGSKTSTSRDQSRNRDLKRKSTPDSKKPSPKRTFNGNVSGSRISLGDFASSSSENEDDDHNNRQGKDSIANRRSEQEPVTSNNNSNNKDGEDGEDGEDGDNSEESDLFLSPRESPEHLGHSTAQASEQFDSSSFHIEVRVPPPPDEAEEYVVHDRDVASVLERVGFGGMYWIQTLDGRRTKRTKHDIAFTERGRKALEHFGEITDSSDANTGDMPSTRFPRSRPRVIDSADSSEDIISSVSKHKDAPFSDDSSSSDDDGNGRPRLKLRTNRSSTRTTRVSNKPPVKYNFGRLDSDSENENARGHLRKRKRQRSETPPRRSGRTQGRLRMSLRERAEDDIEEVEIHKAPAKATGARESFKQLPSEDEFRNRHCMGCDTCGQVGNSAERGEIIFCQGCTMAYHRQCIGNRTTREHLVTKVAEEDFVLQCRRCVEFARRKDKFAPHQGRCSACKEQGEASRPFRVQKGPVQEQRDREQNGGKDPIQHVAPRLINNVDNVMFRCQMCFRAFHFYHLKPKQENLLEGSSKAQKSASRFAEYSASWTCHDCDNRPASALRNGSKANVGSLIAWRPVQNANYQSGQTVEEIPEDDKEYLVKWANMSHYNCRWKPGPWVWGFTMPAMRKAFANRDNGKNLPKMRTEDAIPEDWLRIDIIFSVKYSNLVQVQIEEVDLARIKEVSRVFAKFKGLPYEDTVWTDPPDAQESERYEDFKVAYGDYVRAKYIRAPSQKKVNNELQKIRGKAGADLRDQFQSKVMLTEQPPDLQGKLMDYQLEGVNWILFQWYQRRNAILADEMGLGKTIQVISFLAALKENHKIWPFLIVVPNATCQNWRNEIKHWAPHLRVVTYFGSERARSLALRHELFGDQENSSKPSPTDLRCHIVVTSYDAAADPSCHKFFARVNWQALVVDEGQRLKNDKTILYAALQALRVPFRLLLTGTPLQNNTRELFNLLQFLDKDNDAEKLQEKYQTLTKEVISELHDLIRPYFLRRTKAQVLKFLPPMGQIIVPVTMTSLQRELYKRILGKNAQLLKAIMGKREGEKIGMMTGLRNVLVQLRKCLCHPFVFNLEVEERTTNAESSHRQLVAASPKLILLELMLPKLRERGHRVLLFSQFLGMLTMMEDFLDGLQLPYLRLDGSHSSLEKQKLIDQYNAPDSNYFAMLLSTRAGGVGINLATADTVIILDPDFNPHQDIQAISRAHRIGQKKKVLVFKLMTRESAEEKIVQVGKKKMVLDHVIVDQMEAENTDGNELESILAFGAQALFNDEAKDIVYDDASIEKLLDRSQIEETTTGDDENSSQENTFSFARIWQNETGGIGEMAMDSDSTGNNIDLWDKILAARTREAEEERRKREAAMGRGKRTRNVVNYGKDVASKTRDRDSDADFSGNATSNDEESDDEAAASTEGLSGVKDTIPPRPMENLPPNQYQLPSTTQPPPGPALQSLPKQRKEIQNQPKHKAREGLPTPQFRPPPTLQSLPQHPKQTEQQRNAMANRPSLITQQLMGYPSEIPGVIDPRRLFSRSEHLPERYTPHVDPNGKNCIGCMNGYGAHEPGACPLKLAGPEFCNLCGLAHYGYQRTCPHLKSERQVRKMLDALQGSAEDPQLVKLAREKLRKLKGSLIHRKKVKEERLVAHQQANAVPQQHRTQGGASNVQVQVPPSTTSAPVVPSNMPGAFNAAPFTSVFQPNWNPMAPTAQQPSPFYGYTQGANQQGQPGPYGPPGSQRPPSPQPWPR